MTRAYQSSQDDLVLKTYIRDECDVLRWVRYGIEPLPDELRPTHFGETERIRKKPTNRLADRIRFENFLRTRGGSCFLYGDRFLVQMSTFDGIPSEITYWASTTDLRFWDHGRTILESFDRYGAEYGYACAWEELEARNQTRVRISSGVATRWCGRDFRRYIPGFYWLNYFSKRYLAKMALDLDAIAARLEGAVYSTANGRVLRLYDRPTDWRSREELVGDVIHETPNIFSIQDIEIPPVLDDIEYDHWSDDVFLQCP